MNSWIKRRAGAVVAAAAVGITGAAVLADQIVTGGGGGDTFHLWVDKDGGNCVDNATPQPYSSADACDTFQLAYAAAEAGDTVGVKDGNYTTAEANITSGTKASDVVFTGESQDGTVVDTEWEISGTHVRFENLTFDQGSSHGWGLRTHANDVTFIDFIARGDYIGFERFAGNNLTWDGGSLGHPADTPGERCGGSPNFDIEPLQINGGSGHVFRNLDVYPQAGLDACAPDGFHEEDFRIHSSNTLIENVEFHDGLNVNRNGGSGKIFLSGSGVQNLLIRNVIFGRVHTDSNNALDANVTGCTMTVEFSTFTDNGMATTGCTVTQTHNIGPGATGVSLTNGRLSSGATTAIDQGGATCSSVPTDIDGDPRPTGSACDKGADEYVP